MVMTQDPAERQRLLEGIRVRGPRQDKPRREAAIGYGRISRSSKTKLERQREYVADAIGSMVCKPWTNTDGVDWFEDDGKSGLRSDRKGYQALVAAVDTGQFSDVVFFKLDRMARDDVELVSQVRKWLARGIRVWDSRIGPITNDNLPFLALMARKESEFNSMRSTAALRKLAQNGTKLGGVPIGYKPVMQEVVVDGATQLVRVPGHYEPDDVAGPIMEEVLRRAADPTISLTSTRRWMNEQLGTHYDHQAFKKTISNVFYCGDVVNFRWNVSLLEPQPYVRDVTEWEHAEHDYPLCTRETMEAIHHRLKRGEVCHRNPANPANYLSGLLRCSCQGRRMRPGHPHTGLTAYACRVCNATRSESTIKEALAKALAAIDTDPSHSIVVAAESVDTARGELEKQLKADRARVKAIGVERAQLTRQQAQGVISVADYYAALELLGDEAEQARARVGQIEGALKNMARGADLSHVADHVDRLRGWCAPAAGGECPRWDVDEVKTRLQFCCDTLTIDPTANTLTVTWSPELAVAVGQPTTSVPLKARRRRR